MSPRPKLRPVPGAEPTVERATEELKNEMSEEEARSIVEKGPLDKWLDSLSPEQCQQYVFWAYRLGTGAAKNPRIERNTALPYDENGCTLEEWLSAKHGGGLFKIHIKWPGVGKRSDEHNGIIWREGAPIYPAAPAPEPGAPGQPGMQAAPPAASDAVTIELLRQRSNPIKDAGDTLRLLKDMGETMKPDAPTAADPLETAKSAIGMAKDIAAMLRPEPAAVAAAVAPVDPVVQLTNQIEAMERLRKVMAPAPVAAGPAPAPAESPGLFQGVKISELVELAKLSGRSDQMFDALLGAEKPGLMDVVAKFGMNAADRPDILTKLGNAVSNLMDAGAGLILRLTPAGQAAQPLLAGTPAKTGTSATGTGRPAAPGGGDAPVLDSAANPEAAASRDAALAELQPLMDMALPYLSAAFQHEESGDQTAERVFADAPQFVEPLAAIFHSIPDLDFWAYLHRQPAIAHDMRHIRFIQFYADFKMRILQGFEEQEEESTEVEEPAGVSHEALAEAAQQAQPQ